jgi:hypothetical protein
MMLNDLYLEINPTSKKIISYPKKLELNWNNVGGISYLDDDKLYDLSWAGYPENGFVKFSKDKRYTISKLFCDDSLFSLIKSKIKNYLSEIRYNEECKGVIINDQYIIDTNDRSKLLLLMKYMECLSHPDLKFKWKAKSGYIDFTSSQFIIIYNKIQEYIQKCFDLEFSLSCNLDECDTVVKILALDLENVSLISNNINVI